MGGGPPGFARRSTCAALLRMPLGAAPAFGHGPITLSGAAFQPLGLAVAAPTPRSYQPPGASAGVWAVPLSLAATGGIAFAFLSSAY